MKISLTIALLLLQPSSGVSAKPTPSNAQASGAPKTSSSPAEALQYITPGTSQMTLGGRSYNRREMEHDTKTGVWTVFFDPKTAASGTGDEGLIFNFYGWNPPTDAKTIAETWRDRQDDVRTVFAFQAPDPASGQPAFFIISETMRVEKGYVYVNITKVAALSGGAFAITYNHKVRGTSAAEIDSNVKAWLLSEYSKKLQTAIGTVTITSEWKDFLAKQR